MARSVPIWKILRFAKVSLYLERFVPRHATAHIHNVLCKLNPSAQTAHLVLANT